MALPSNPRPCLRSSCTMSDSPASSVLNAASRCRRLWSTAIGRGRNGHRLYSAFAPYAARPQERQVLGITVQQLADARSRKLRSRAWDRLECRCQAVRDEIGTFGNKIIIKIQIHTARRSMEIIFFRQTFEKMHLDFVYVSVCPERPGRSLKTCLRCAETTVSAPENYCQIYE